MPRHKAVHGHHVRQTIIGNDCFGCGPDNEAGLRLKFVADPQSERSSAASGSTSDSTGPPAHAHGGIIATILDEAMGKVSKLRGVVALTGSMTIDYLKPVPLNKPLITEGWEGRVRGREHTGWPRSATCKGRCWRAAKASSSRLTRTACSRSILKKKHSDAT